MLAVHWRTTDFRRVRTGGALVSAAELIRIIKVSLILLLPCRMVYLGGILFETLQDFVARTLIIGPTLKDALGMQKNRHITHVYLSTDNNDSEELALVQTALGLSLLPSFRFVRLRY